MTLKDYIEQEHKLLKVIKQHKYNITGDEYYPYKYFPKGTPVEDQNKLDELRSELSAVIEQRNAIIKARRSK